MPPTGWAPARTPSSIAGTVKEVLREVRTLCEGPLAESFVDADRNPPKYDPKSMSVEMPESFKKSYAALMESGFWRLDLPEHLGGSGAPPSVRWSVAEMVLGANPAIYMYMSGPGFASIVDDLGNEEQKQWAQIMVDREWGATMVLTEPDAGSDVGAGTTKAFLQEDGSWHIEGVKRFITSGEHDMTENIIHLVLARPANVEGLGGVGTKGLSLFFVPKYHFDAEGNPGERNGAFVTNVEKKMGLKVSTTCEITFGQNGVPAQGWLVGDVHDGIAQMFKVIEYARMMVGTKAIATLSTGYLNALDYAKQRVQGADLTQMMDKTAPRVTITAHPDVRRSLMLQKSYAEGMRALVHLTVVLPGPDPPGRERRHPRGRRRHGHPGQRPAAADRQGRRLGALLRAARDLAADLRRLGLPAGLPDRAVHPRRQDRHPVRGHHGDPGPGLLLPQDGPRPVQGRDVPRGAGGRVRQGRRGRLADPRARAARQGAGGHAGRDRRAGRLGDGLAVQPRPRSTRSA